MGARAPDLAVGVDEAAPEEAAAAEAAETAVEADAAALG